MTEEKYNTKDIKHIDEKSQEYIAKGNRMTEEIMIDGVNVAGCMNYSFKEFINFTECPDCCGEYLDKRCDNHPNCNYKQLKRLEQENKELKSQRDEARIEYNNLMLDIISDIPFTGEICVERNISIKNHLYQTQKALASLEEIRGLASPHCTQCLQVLNIINEVLNDSRE